jgi:hypothetical protein
MANKYRACKTVVDGVVFASVKESRRYSELKLLERAGAIRQLELQPKFVLTVDGTKVCTYLGDFAYFENNARVVEDVKGMKTPVYRLKRKLLLALYPGIDHREV